RFTQGAIFITGALTKHTTKTIISVSQGVHDIVRPDLEAIRFVRADVAVGSLGPRNPALIKTTYRRGRTDHIVRRIQGRTRLLQSYCLGGTPIVLQTVGVKSRITADNVVPIIIEGC